MNHPKQEFINLLISRHPLLYRILPGRLPLGKLSLRRLHLVSRRSWVRIPLELPVEFVQTLGKHCLRSVVAERSSALDSSSGVVRMWVRIPAWPVAALVSLSKTLKAVGPVMFVKELRTLIVKEEGLAPVFLDSRIEHPAGRICAHYKSSVLCICIIIIIIIIIFFSDSV